MPVDYSKSKIYKLTTPHDETLVYYGSTVNPLYKRKQVHKVNYKKGYYKITSCKLFELGIDDVEITLVENVNCNNKEELTKRERHYIENNNCVNKVIPGRTNKEYYDDNKDKIKKYREENKDKFKEYYETNKQQILEQKKEYYEINKDIIRDKEKQYRENNKDTIKQRKKDYYEKNKEVINQKIREKKKLN